jgi:hypothetical protein
MAKLGRWQRQLLTLLVVHGPQDGEALTFLATGQADKETRYLCARALRQLATRGLVAPGAYRACQVYAITEAGMARLERDAEVAQQGGRVP